jgi:hypothetical protein
MALVALLREALLVHLIRVGTGRPPYGYRYRRDHTNPDM